MYNIVYMKVFAILHINISFLITHYFAVFTYYLTVFTKARIMNKELTGKTQVSIAF